MSEWSWWLRACVLSGAGLGQTHSQPSPTGGVRSSLEHSELIAPHALLPGHDGWELRRHLPLPSSIDFPVHNIQIPAY